MKKICFMFLAFLVFVSLPLVSAFSLNEDYREYSSNYDIWYYKEDLHGHNQGFTLKHYWLSPSHSYSVSYEEDDDVEWSYYSPYGRKVDRGYDRYESEAISAAFAIYGARRGRVYYPSYSFSYGYRGYGWNYGYNYGGGYGGYVRNYW